jgi:hypothetical protein
MKNEAKLILQKSIIVPVRSTRGLNKLDVTEYDFKQNAIIYSLYWVMPAYYYQNVAGLNFDFIVPKTKNYEKDNIRRSFGNKFIHYQLMQEGLELFMYRQHFKHNYQYSY